MTTIDRIKAALAKVEVCEWFADEVTNNGLTIVDDGKNSGIFPIKAETYEALFIAACNPAAISELIASHEALGRQVAASSATLQEGQEEWLSSVRNIGTQMANVLFNLRQRETVAGAEADTIKAIIEAWDAIPMSPPQQATVLTQPALEQAIGFIESLTADPLLIGDETEMTLEDVQAYARIELTSIRKALASSTPPHTQEEGERGEGPAPEKHVERPAPVRQGASLMPDTVQSGSDLRSAVDTSTQNHVLGDERPYRIDPALPAWDVVPNAERIIAALPDDQRAIIAKRLMPVASKGDAE